MSDPLGESASILPNIMPSIGEQLRYNQQREDQQTLRKDEQRSRREQRRLQMVNFAENNLDPAKYLVGDATLDEHTTAQLEDLKNSTFKFLKENPDTDSADLALQINQGVAPIAVAHAKIKSVIGNIEKNLALAKTDLPVLNDGKLRDEARKNALLKTGPDGHLVYKSPEEIDGNSNYVQQVINNHPELVVDNEQPFIKGIQSAKTSKVAVKTGEQHAGVRVKKGFTAELSPYRDLNVDQQGNVKGLRYKTEAVNLPDGKNFDVVPDDLFQLATADPNSRLAYYALWNANKAKYGVGNLPNDAPESKLMQRKFFLDYLKVTNIDHSSFSEDRQQSNNNAVNNEQLGLGTPIEQAQKRSDISESRWNREEGVRQDHRVNNADHQLANHKTLKSIPNAGTLKPSTKKTIPGF